MPRVGDLIIETCMKTRDTWIGIVYKISKDPYGHGNTFIEWVDAPPRNYQKRYGYSSTNIHNQRPEFRMFRDGEELL